MNRKRIGVVVVNYNDFETTRVFLDNIIEFEYISQIVVVDNCSSDASFEILQNKYQEFEKIDVIKTEKNGGYGYGNNVGIKWLKAHYDISRILICNPDTSFEDVTVSVLSKHLDNIPNAAVVAPVMLNSSGEKQINTAWMIPSFFQYCMFASVLLGKLCNSFFIDTDVFLSQEPVEVGCVAGSMLMLNLEKFADANIYDENIFLYCEETVLGIKVAKNGYKTFLIPDCFFNHCHSASINKSIPKALTQQKIMWSSRMYVIEKYMNGNLFKKIFANICRCVSLIEVWFLNRPI
ncbi:MAG: glycosyltransferase [Clostridium sp.]|nr:glycosyltransferase [Clostridium sp.]